MILVTGATGFIGSNLVPRLVLSSNVRCLIRPASANKLKRDISVEIFAKDLASAEDLESALHGIRCVIHLAALLRKEDPEEIHKVNVEGTRRLVEAAKKQGVSRFIFVSTENALRDDLHDAYATSKREAENIVRSFPNHLIIRPCFIYGRGDNHGLGRLFSMAKNSAVVPLFGGLEKPIQPIYIDDMVEYLVRAVQNDLRGEYLIAGCETISINQFIKKALKAAHLEKTCITMPYFFYYLAAILGDLFFRSAGWGMTQLENIYDSRTYSIDETVRAFNYSPRSLEVGLAEWLGAPLNQ